MRNGKITQNHARQRYRHHSSGTKKPFSRHTLCQTQEHGGKLPQNYLFRFPFALNRNPQQIAYQKWL